MLTPEPTYYHLLSKTFEVECQFDRKGSWNVIYIRQSREEAEQMYRCSALEHDDDCWRIVELTRHITKSSHPIPDRA